MRERCEYGWFSIIVHNGPKQNPTTWSFYQEWSWKIKNTIPWPLVWGRNKYSSNFLDINTRYSHIKYQDQHQQYLINIKINNSNSNSNRKQILQDLYQSIISSQWSVKSIKSETSNSTRYSERKIQWMARANAANGYGYGQGPNNQVGDQNLNTQLLSISIRSGSVKAASEKKKHEAKQKPS